MTENASFRREEEQIWDRRGFFIASEVEESRVEDEEDGDREVSVGAVVQQKRLKEMLRMVSLAPRSDSVKPEHMSALVEIVLQNFKKTKRAEDAGSVVRLTPGSELDCPGCQRLLWEPVTVCCGHTYCRTCSLRSSPNKCGICGDEVGTDLKANVLLSGLLEKWFPDEVQRSRRISEAEGLLRNKRFEEAVTLTTRLLNTDPANVRLRACRAEAYRALRQYGRALDDWNLCASVAPSLEVLFCKAKLLKEADHVDDAFRLFLQCLSVDEEFQQARQEVENILRELLWPPCETSLKQSAHDASACLRHKAGVSRTRAVPDPASTRPPPQTEDGPQRSERSSLVRAQSLRVHCVGGVTGEGLKRVSSAPQLGEKGALLKRKLSGLETEAGVTENNDNKHKKPGAAASAAPAAPAEGDQVHPAVPRDRLDPNDFECSLCMRLFFEPVTTPCGHSFCKSCLQRSLDHSPQCPLCKESLKLYLSSRMYSVTRVLDDIIRRYLSEEHAGRQKVQNEETKELSDLENRVPIFVCTMAYPTVPCPLHVFEPRYRLMMRRCIETGTRQFGMCISDTQKGFADFGCMLHIRNVHFLPDGRSVVDTIGGQRFHVLTRDMRDGYCIANIEYLQDHRVQGEEEHELQDLYDQVYRQASVWFHALENRFRNQILQHFGPMPEKENDIQSGPNGPACCWWLLAVLPVDPRYQLSVLSMTTLKERLVKIQHILTYLQSTQPAE